MLISSFKNNYDYVFIDSPPVLPVADMNILSEIVDGIVFVIKADDTPKNLVKKAIKSLSAGDVVGIVLNGFQMPSKKYSKYYGY